LRQYIKELKIFHGDSRKGNKNCFFSGGHYAPSGGERVNERKILFAIVIVALLVLIALLVLNTFLLLYKPSVKPEAAVTPEVAELVNAFKKEFTWVDIKEVNVNVSKKSVEIITEQYSLCAMDIKYAEEVGKRYGYLVSVCGFPKNGKLKVYYTFFAP
jgi:hypothetical protein